MAMSGENESEFRRAEWIDLPVDVTANILERLGMEDILKSAEKVCTTWRRICCDPYMWRAIHIKRSDFGNERRIIPKLLRRAVDRSQGQLLHLSFENSGYDDVLNYIVDRSSGIKRLTLNNSYRRFTGKGLVEAFNKLPHLEELHLTEFPVIRASDIVNIGNACPLLKSFTFWFFSQCMGRPERKREFCIKEYMPNLRHLRLISNLIDNEGVEAILDGCPKLVSLDLRQCFGLDLGGALRKRCSEQIKHLKPPYDFRSVI